MSVDSHIPTCDSRSNGGPIMENSQYAHLVKPLSIGTPSEEEMEKIQAIGPGNAARMFHLHGPDRLEGMSLNLSWGVHTETGDWHGRMDPHAHSSPECLLFVGLDTASARYLGAEITICLGEEQESYTFNEPTLVIIPPGLPHGPITTDKMFSPRGFGCWSVQPHPESEITWMGEGVSELSAGQKEAAPEGMHFAAPDKIIKSEPREATGKYLHLIKPLKTFLLAERGKVNPERLNQILPPSRQEARKAGEKPGPGSADHMILLSGNDLEGMGATIAWGLCSRAGISRRGVGAHTHPADEVLVYLGMDPANPDNLGAEIEVDLGKEHERHFIDKPSAIVCPASLPHMPSVTHWVDRPYAFFAVCLSGEHEVEPFD